MKRIIAASQNKDKLKEIRAITDKFGFELVSMADAGLADLEIVEDGDSFEENSFIKANAVCRLTGEMSLADDSGLMVDCLDGAPGVYSARFAGEHCSYSDNNEKLLALMSGFTRPEERRAVFVSVITLLWPNGEKLVARGECPGRIIDEPRGEHGFGYDPLFVPDGFSKTFSELTSDEKNAVSHRAKALFRLDGLLKERGL